MSTISTKNELLTVSSFNCRGLGIDTKLKTVIDWLKTNHNGIILLQETHTTVNDEDKFKKLWGNEIIFNHGTSSRCGIAILLPFKLSYKIKDIVSDNKGRFLLLNIAIDENEYVIINIYAPTKDKINDQIEFLKYVELKIANYRGNNIIMGGDFNVCLNNNIDKDGGKVEKASTYNKNLHDFIEDYRLVDIWRQRNKNKKLFTWRSKTKSGVVQSRLDMFLVSENLQYIIPNVCIKTGLKSDHSLINFSIKLLNTIKRGLGSWKMNLELLKDKEYV